jgi:hypothetical protein
MSRLAPLPVARYVPVGSVAVHALNAAVWCVGYAGPVIALDGHLYAASGRGRRDSGLPSRECGGLAGHYGGGTKELRWPYAD